MDIDVGTKALREDFSEQDQNTLVNNLIHGFTSKMSEVFKDLTVKGHPVVCNPNGELVGKWGKGNMHTMTH